MNDTAMMDEIERRGIRRLCHATHPENLLSIAEHGLLSVTQLGAKQLRAVANDDGRYDGHLDFISCSIEVPNTYYMQRVETDHDWVVIRIWPSPLLRPSTRYSQTNAARDCGANIRDGVEAFRSLFDPQSGGWPRQPHHAQSCPTNLQSEVLVKQRISPSLFRSLVVPSRNFALRYRSVLEQFCREAGIGVVVSGATFDAYRLRELVWSGQTPILRKLDW